MWTRDPHRPGLGHGEDRDRDRVRHDEGPTGEVDLETGPESVHEGLYPSGGAGGGDGGESDLKRNRNTQTSSPYSGKGRNSPLHPVRLRYPLSSPSPYPRKLGTSPYRPRRPSLLR